MKALLLIAFLYTQIGWSQTYNSLNYSQINGNKIRLITTLTISEDENKLNIFNIADSTKKELIITQVKKVPNPLYAITFDKGWSFIGNSGDKDINLDEFSIRYQNQLTVGTKIFFDLYKYEKVELSITNGVKYWKGKRTAIYKGDSVYIHNPGPAFSILADPVLKMFDFIEKKEPVFAICPPIPSSGKIVTDLGFPVLQEDKIIIMKDNASNYEEYFYNYGNWTPKEPEIKINQPFIVQNYSDVDEPGMDSYKNRPAWVMIKK